MGAAVLGIGVTPAVFYQLDWSVWYGMLAGLGTGLGITMAFSVALTILHMMTNSLLATKAHEHRFSDELFAYVLSVGILATTWQASVHSLLGLAVILGLSALYSLQVGLRWWAASRDGLLPYTPFRLPYPVLTALKMLPQQLDGEVEATLNQALKDFSLLSETAREAEPALAAELREVAEVATTALVALIQRAALVNRMLQHVDKEVDDGEILQAAATSLSELRARAKSLHSITGATLCLATQVAAERSPDALHEQVEKLRLLADTQAQIKALLSG